MRSQSKRGQVEKKKPESSGPFALQPTQERRERQLRQLSASEAGGNAGENRTAPSSQPRGCQGPRPEWPQRSDGEQMSGRTGLRGRRGRELGAGQPQSTERGLGRRAVCPRGHMTVSADRTARTHACVCTCASLNVCVWVRLHERRLPVCQVGIVLRVCVSGALFP